VKRGARIITKSSKFSSNAVVSPPKAGVGAAHVTKDKVHRRRNPFNEMLRRRDGEVGVSESHAAHSPVGRGSQEDIQPLKQHEKLSEFENIDDIAELGTTASFARQERTFMQEELEKLQQQRQADRDAMHDLRQQLAETQRSAQSPSNKSSFDERRNSGNRPSSERSSEDILRQNYELRRSLAQLQEHMNSQRHDTTATHGEAEWDELSFRLHTTEKESQERLQQLLSLKSSISSLTRGDAQVTDSELAESFSQLANRVREWVITNMRHAKLDLANAPLETAKSLVSIVGDYENVMTVNRIALCQAIVGSALTQALQEPVIIGLPDTGPLGAIRQSAKVLRDAGPTFYEWRRATIRAMAKSGIQHVVQEERKNALHRIAGEIGHLLFTMTSVHLTLHAQSALMGILSSAAELQHTLALQRAHYQLSFFRKQDDILELDDRTMEPINDMIDDMDEDGNTPTKRTFLFCVFPCLEKFGDERGEHVQLSNVLLKARVCCGVG
jgi:hypothetical protein